jgi:hypothetical protein
MASIPEVRRELEAATGRVLQSVAADTRQLVVVCASETEQEELLKWDQCQFIGGTLRICRTQPEMTGDEILDFVKGKLEFDEEKNRAKRTVAGSSGPMVRVAEPEKGRTPVYSNRDEVGCVSSPSDRGYPLPTQHKRLDARDRDP